MEGGNLMVVGLPFFPKGRVFRLCGQPPPDYFSAASDPARPFIAETIRRPVAKSNSRLTWLPTGISSAFATDRA